MFELEIQSLGPIQSGKLEVYPLTILCGDNNSGKTYASYALYGALNALLTVDATETLRIGELSQSESLTIELNELGLGAQASLEKASDHYRESLPDIFSDTPNAFKTSRVSFNVDLKDAIFQMTRQSIHSEWIVGGSGITVKIDKKQNSTQVVVTWIVQVDADEHPKTQEEIRDVVKDILRMVLNDELFPGLPTPAFLLPAERSGLNLFYKELNVNRNELFHRLGVNVIANSLRGMNKQLKRSLTSYSMPISDYITFLNRIDFRLNDRSDYEDIAEEIEEQISRGKYSINDQRIVYQPIRPNGNSEHEGLSLHVSSSTAKTMFGLVFFLRHMATRGQTLIIDEPELNLHPDNQRKMARVLAKIANRGINVVISTHSDYIVKEINNLLMLSAEFSKRSELMEKYCYSSSEILNAGNVCAYMFSDGIISPMEIDAVEGIIAETFDEVINQYNNSSDDIYTALREEMAD